jgi:organic radical activating enzyme
MVEQVYFAGGEPLIMEEHYKILKALVDIGKAKEVRLIYNTNFTKLSYKKLNVLDLWPEFEDVSVGASLDAMGPRAELIRNGTVWKDIEKNREDMLKKCPQVDFYVSATLSAFNVRHVVDFHNTWVEKGLIGYKDWNMNVVQDPEYYRADILPTAMKQKITEEYNQHIEKITPHDDLGRATNGFKSAIKFINANDNTKMLPSFKRYVELLDKRRRQNTLDVFPELGEVING